MNALMSITHRITGAALSVGTLMVLWLLLAAASGPESYEIFRAFAGSLIGRLMIFGWSVALFYHMANGIRHLVFDLGYLFKKESAAKSGYLTLIVTALLTAIFWLLVGMA